MMMHYYDDDAAAASGGGGGGSNCGSNWEHFNCGAKSVTLHGCDDACDFI